jgi:hypothetical protein
MALRLKCLANAGFPLANYGFLALMPQSIKNCRLRFFLATLSHARLFWSLVE